MKREIHKIDVAGKTVGRIASAIAILLRGKHKVTFQSHIDCGDIVEVTNYKLVKFTGNKMADKKYYHYSGYQSGLREDTAKKKMAEKPEFVLWNAVYHMLPETRLRSGQIKRLKFVD